MTGKTLKLVTRDGRETTGIVRDVHAEGLVWTFLVECEDGTFEAVRHDRAVVVRPPAQPDRPPPTRIPGGGVPA